MPRSRSRPAHAAWSPAELAALRRLDSPAAIQAFLDRLPYSTEERYRCPRSVLRDRVAHCFDGAVFAAAALDHLGFPALLVDLAAVRDDDHVLAVFRVDGRLGAIAKSNFSGLRFREPVYRGLRELAMSYFEDYFNVHGEKTLRAVSVPVSLRGFERLRWRTEDAIASRLGAVRHQPLLGRRAVRRLQPVDARSYRAGMLGVDRRGLWRGQTSVSKASASARAPGGVRPSYPAAARAGSDLPARGRDKATRAAAGPPSRRGRGRDRAGRGREWKSDPS